MRQGQQQQNRRGRGRTGGGGGSSGGSRKGQSPLSRSFESSGPDVKIRGTAQHIAEKYMALARDAIGSGDLVLGENYLQHAEHYNRIIMAAQVPSQSPFDATTGNGQRVARPEGELLPGENADFDDDEAESEQPSETSQNFEPQQRHYEPQAQREHQQPRQQREGRSFEPRTYDNRDNRGHEPRQNEPRQYDNRGQDNRDNRSQSSRGYDNRGQDNRGNDNRGNDNRGQESRGHSGQDFRAPRQSDQQRNFEPRHQDQPRSPNGNGEQPRAFEQPRAVFDTADAQPPVPDASPVSETKVPNPNVPRGRRRRGRNENGTDRPFAPQPVQFGDPVGEPAHEQPSAPSEHPAPGRSSDGDEQA